MRPRTRPVTEPEGGTVEDPIADFFRDGYRGLLGWMAGRHPEGVDIEDAVQEAVVRAWFMAGRHPHEYEHIAAAVDVYAGKRVVTLRCVAGKPTGFGTLMQQCAPDQYVGDRIRFSGALRSRDAGGWGGLWFRVDGTTGKSLSFDNMQDRAVKGTTGWARYEVVLDVPHGATLLAYGVLLCGDGELGIADLRIDRVGDDVATTNRRHLDRPANLDFSEVTDDGGSTTPR